MSMTRIQNAKECTGTGEGAKYSNIEKDKSKYKPTPMIKMTVNVLFWFPRGLASRDRIELKDQWTKSTRVNVDSEHWRLRRDLFYSSFPIFFHFSRT